MSRELFYVVVAASVFLLMVAGTFWVAKHADENNTEDVWPVLVFAVIAFVVLVGTIFNYGSTLPSAALPEPTKEVGK